MSGGWRDGSGVTKVLSSIPSTHMVAHYSGDLCLSLAHADSGIHRSIEIDVGKILVYIKK